MPDLDLDLDSVDLDDVSLDDVDLSDFGEVNESVDYPHIKVGSKSLKEFLKVATKVCSSGGKDIISKAVCLVYDKEKEKVVCYATDFDVYVEVDLESLDMENILTEPVVIATSVLTKLCSAVPTNTLIYKKEDSFFIRLYGGDMEIETNNIVVDKFKFSDSVEKVDSISAEGLYSVIKDFGPVVSAAVNPIEKRIVVESDGSFATYLFSVLRCKGIKGEYDIKSKDIEVLKILNVSKKDEELLVNKTVEGTVVKRVQIVGSNYKYTFLVSEAQVSDTLKSNMETVLGDSGVYIDYVQIAKMCDLACTLPFALGKVGMKYSESGISLDVKTKKGTSNLFDIPGSIEGKVDTNGKELVVQAKLLMIVLKSFAGKASIRLSLAEEGIGIKADDYEAVIYNEAV